MSELETIVYHGESTITFERNVVAQCPHKRETDVYECTIRYAPNETLVEKHSLIDYLESYSDTEISHEELCDTIYENLTETLDPEWMTVVLSGTDPIETEVRRQ